MTEYSFSKNDVDVLGLNRSIKNNVTISKICEKVLLKNSNELIIQFNEALTTPENNELNTVVGDHNNLDYQKKFKVIDIDKKTKELIGQGFAYEGKTFSLSIEAQSNWVSLKVLSSSLSWPISITTIDDTEYNLSEIDVEGFLNQAVSVKQSHLDSGRSLKIATNLSSDQTEFNLVVDNR